MVEIYGTLGPACDSEETLEAMLRAGMTGVRLNLSHTTLARAEDQLRRLHNAARRLSVTPKVLIDMQGPELRLGDLPQPLTLTAGSTVVLGGEGLPVPQAALPWLLPGRTVLLDDGKLTLEVLQGTGEGQALARVAVGGLLRSRKSIALPGCEIHPPAVTPADLENLRHAARSGVTGVMQPFVRDRRDLEAVRAALAETGADHVRLLAKIEDLNGFRHLDDLIPAADEIVIARGDLGSAVPLWELPALQKDIAAACRRAGRPFMVVTQLLASMEERPVPTRAEVSDIFNAVLDGASSVMVTGETAVGRYPVEVIRFLSHTVGEALRYLAR